MTRGCVEDECKLEKLLKSKISTPEDLARFKRLDASTKELSKSAASIMSTFLSSLWALKEANSALLKKRQEDRESSASLSPIGSFVSARQTFLDKLEVEAFNTIKDVVLTFLTGNHVNQITIEALCRIFRPKSAAENLFNAVRVETHLKLYY